MSVLAYFCCLTPNVFFGKLSKKQENICETTLAISDLAQYSYQCLVDKDVIVEGRFPVVFTAKLPENGNQIVVKKLLATNNDAKKSLVKEARLLSKLQHPNHSRGMNSRATPLNFVCTRISHYACY